MCALWTRDDGGERRRARLVGEALTDIRDQRAKLRLELPPGITSLAGLSGSLLDFDASGLSVEVAQLKKPTHAFDGVSLSCYFRVRDAENRNRERYMAFDAEVLSAGLGPAGMVVLRLAYPDALRDAQLRRGVRVRADARLVPDFSLWEEFAGRVDLTTRKPLFGAPEMQAGAFRVGDFSANGVRLLVGAELMRKALPEAAKGARYAMRFAVRAEPAAAPTVFWTLAVLRNVFYDPQTSEAALGFEFVAEGETSEADGMVWRPLKFDEVPGLGRFVFRWNLDLYREKGLGE